MTLPTDRDARNALPVWDGCLTYFPDCWAEIAKVSVLGNKQHKLGGPLRWERGVSIDHGNKVLRHMLDHAAGNVFDTDGTYHLAKAAWRALAALQVAIEANQGQTGPLPPHLDPIAHANNLLYHENNPSGPKLILKLESEDPDHIGRSLKSLSEEFKP